MSKDFENVLDSFRDTKVYFGILGLAFIVSAVFLFTEYLMVALLVLGVGLTSWTVNHLGIKQIGIELATFSTVILAMVYGSAIGAVAGFSLILLQVVAGQYTGSYMIWVIPSYAIVGFLAGMFQGEEIFVVGAAATIGMQAVFAFLSAVTSLGNLERYLPYAITNIMFNLMVFYYIAPVMIELMI